MSRFAGGDPTRIHHLDRDAEFLIELPDRAQILMIRTSHGDTGGETCVTPRALPYQYADSVMESRFKQLRSRIEADVAARGAGRLCGLD